LNKKEYKQMYNYSDLPPNETPNSQGAYPPPPYNPGYYQPQPPYRSSAYSVWRVVGLVFLTWFVLALLIGHHGFFWPLLLIAAFFYFKGRHQWGYRHHHYGRPYYRYNQPPAMPYNYYQAPAQPGYYPPQPPQAYPPTGTPETGWPKPTDAPGPDQNH
jgi:hypothetical protein